MIFHTKKAKGIFFILSLLLCLCIGGYILLEHNTVEMTMGAFVHREEVENMDERIGLGEETIDIERFQRPSKQPRLELKYEFKGPAEGSKEPPYIPAGYPRMYQTPEDVIQAYYSILRDAENMKDFYGGCGTIGWARIPYPYAYELLSESTKEKVSLEQFQESFRGIGYTSLLKLKSLYQPPNSLKNLKYYMVEIEVITGPPIEKENRDQLLASYFAYYYGLVTVINEGKAGWKIKSIDYVPEDFLCAPMHGWAWHGEALVQIIYGSWYKIIDKIDKVEEDGSNILIYASGKGKNYLFSFVRLTNGEDKLLHEYILVNNQWQEVNLLKPDDQFAKFSILNPNIKKDER